MISLLFLAATTAYAMHRHEAAAQASQPTEHCDLCLQLGAAAGAPAAIAPLVPVPSLYWLPVRSASAVPEHRLPHYFQARAPPGLLRS
ncbi:MAG: hypothetical protein QM696_06390 [Steroidobacteraceae bacterium]